MISTLKNKIPHQACAVLLLSFITSSPINAATFESLEDSADESFNLDSDISNIEIQRLNELQATEKANKNYQLILGLIEKKQYKEANTKISKLIQQTPNQPIYYTLKASLQLIDKNLSGAEQSFLKVIELDTRNIQALSGLAKITLANKQYDLAKRYANKVIAINPQIIKAYQVLVDIALKQQGIDAVEKILQNALLEVRNDLKAELAIMKSLGEIYINKKQPKKLLQLAINLVSRNKYDTSALSFLAETQMINRDKTNAEKTLRKIITQEPNNAKYLLILARLLDKQKNKETEILKLLDKAALNSDNPAQILTYKTTVLINQKNYKQAFSTAKQVHESNPSKSNGYILKADIYLAKKEYQNALKNYHLAYKIDSDIKSLSAMLKILTQQNKTNEIISLLEKELSTSKKNPTIQFWLAVTYQNAGQLDLSSQHYEALLLKQKNNIIALNNLAGIYSVQNNPRALKLAEQAYQLSPKSGAIADTYGYILLKIGDKKESLNILQQAAKLDSVTPDIQLHLAEAYIANHMKYQAKNILQSLLHKEAITKEEFDKLLKSEKP